MLKISDLHDEIIALGEMMAHRLHAREAEVECLLRWWALLPDADEARARLEGGDLLPAGAAPPNALIAAERTPPRDVVVVGVDGSQIMPDRHAAILYYLLQVGGMIFRYDGSLPLVRRRPALYYTEAELYDEKGFLVGAREVGMRREMAELEFLLSLVEEAAEGGPPLPLLALTDGPLLWPYAGRSQEEDVLLHRLFSALEAMKRLHAMPIGFIERPSGRALVQMIWQLCGVEEGGAAPRVDDVAFLERLLPPGHRTAWFLRRSAMQDRYERHGHPIWSCYLNVGEAEEPVIVRLETPAWAARREMWAATMLQALVHQSGLTGGHPYVLARAHELALVTVADKAALEQRLYREVAARGLRPRPSAKARQKARLGKR